MSKVGLVTYNVLTENYCNKKQFSKNDPNYLRNDKRKKKIKEFIEKWITQGKIICLQEVSRNFSEELTVLFSNKNYTYIDSLYGNSYNGYMGVAIAYPHNHYELLDCKIKKISDVFQKIKKRCCEQITDVFKSYLPKCCKDDNTCFDKASWRKNTAIALKLKEKSSFVLNKDDYSSIPFWAVTYHMPCTWKDPRIMMIHTASLGKFIDNITDCKEHCILGIDFNSQPDSHQYRILTKGYSDGVDDFLRKDDPNWGTIYEPITLLKSSYKQIHGAEPICTNYAYCSNGGTEFKATIDYIFVTKNITVYSVKRLNDQTELLPNKDQPSDHLPLECDLVIEFKKKENKKEK